MNISDDRLKKIIGSGFADSEIKSIVGELIDRREQERAIEEFLTHRVGCEIDIEKQPSGYFARAAYDIKGNVHIGISNDNALAAMADAVRKAMEAKND